jgi:hypothetical protein
MNLSINNTKKLIFSFKQCFDYPVCPQEMEWTAEENFPDIEAKGQKVHF